jgi:hypothetical protein
MCEMRSHVPLLVQYQYIYKNYQFPLLCKIVKLAHCDLF